MYFPFLNCVTKKYINGPICEHTYDKRTDKTYIKYSFKTSSNMCFEKLRLLWYTDKKIVPEFKLTPLISKIWYIGDGCLLKRTNKRQTSIGIKLSTNCFDKLYVDALSDMLSEFGAKTSSINKKEFVIIIPRIKIKEFLSYIGPCDISGYEYKWNYIPCKYNDIEVNGIKSIKHFELDIISEYNSGIRVSELKRKYGCANSLIVYYLNKNKVIRRS